MAHRGYPAEIHLVTTLDGYILELHRIPYSRQEHKRWTAKNRLRHKQRQRHTSGDRPVVFLQHGLLCSSSDWVLNAPDKGLGNRPTSRPTTMSLMPIYFCSLPVGRSRLRRVDGQCSWQHLFPEAPIPQRDGRGLLEILVMRPTFFRPSAGNSFFFVI